MLKNNKKEYQGEKDDLQKFCYRWFCLEFPFFKRLLHHSPNGGKRSGREALKLKEMGAQPDFPDFFLAVPKGNYSGLFIELKVKGEKLTKQQEEYILLLRNKKYRTEVVSSMDDFMEVVRKYLVWEKKHEDGRK